MTDFNDAPLDVQASIDAEFGLTPTRSALVPAAPIDLDAVFASLPQAATRQAAPVHRVAVPRQRENEPRLMRWEAFKAAHPRKTLDAAGKRRYQYLCTQAARGRRRLVTHPELVAWYVQRETLAAVGLDPAGAGPDPTTLQGKKAATRRVAEEAAHAAREHDYLMTCQIPDPAMVRIGERSPEALAERRSAAAERRRIENYRLRYEGVLAQQRACASALDNEATSPQQRRLARAGTAWDVRVQEDELWMGRSDLRVRCHTQTQPVPMIRRRHRAGA